MGSVIPLGEFKSTDIGSLNSGYAENGFALNFDGDYFLHNRLAVSARLNFGMTDMNELAFIKKIESELSEYIEPNGENVYSNFSNWQWSAPMLGLKYNYPIVINILYIDAGIFSGISISKIPDQNIHIEDNLNKQTIFSENYGKQSLAIPFMADLGLRFILNQKMQLKLSSGYFQSKVNYSHLNYIVKYNATSIEKELANYAISVPIKNLNFCAGIIYTL